MEEVHAVGDAADVDERSDRQDRRERRLAGEHPEDHAARQERVREEPAAPDRPVRERDVGPAPEGRDEADQAHRPEDPPRPLGELDAGSEQDDGQRRTDEELGHPGVGAVVEPVETRAALVQRGHPRGGEQRRRCRGRRAGSAATASAGPRRSARPGGRGRTAPRSPATRSAGPVTAPRRGSGRTGRSG